MRYLLFACSFFLLSHLSAVGFDEDTARVHEAFVSKYLPIIIAEKAFREPPADIQETIPNKTAQNLTWIPGYWGWVTNKNDFRWICGVWRQPPPDHTWIPGSWSKTSDGWLRSPGFWSPVPADQITYIAEAPPADREDNVIAAGENNFWIPGYWQYDTTTKKYEWLEGKWASFQQNWILSPSTYFWTPKGYVFVPLYWDYPLADRGTLYTCAPDDKTPVGYHPNMILQLLYIYYPNYTGLFWHSWQFNQHWWNDCNCAPPWWKWNTWWTLTPGDTWGLWWWWTHPNSAAPSWMTAELSGKIAPPNVNIIERLNRIPAPPFDLKSAGGVYLPHGTGSETTVERPTITAAQQDNPNVPVIPETILPSPTPPPRSVISTPPPAPASSASSNQNTHQEVINNEKKLLEGQQPTPAAAPQPVNITPAPTVAPPQPTTGSSPNVDQHNVPIQNNDPAPQNPNPPLYYQQTIQSIPSSGGDPIINSQTIQYPDNYYPTTYDRNAPAAPTYNSSNVDRHNVPTTNSSTTTFPSRSNAPVKSSNQPAGRGDKPVKAGD